MVNWNAARLLEAAAQTESGPEFLMAIADSIGSFALEVKESLARIEELLKDPVDEARSNWGVGARPEAIVRRVRLDTPGVAVQGPNVSIPRGVVSVIRQRRHDASRNGYIATNERDVSSTGSRVEMQNNDTVVLQISNWNKIWFDSDTNTTDFELIAEQ